MSHSHTASFSLDELGATVGCALLLLWLLFFCHERFAEKCNHLQQQHSFAWQTQRLAPHDGLKLQINSAQLKITFQGNLIFQQPCEPKLKYMCQGIQQNRMQVTQVLFYHLAQAKQPALWQLAQIEFYDPQQRLHRFEYNRTAPYSSDALALGHQQIKLFLMVVALVYSSLALGMICYVIKQPSSICRDYYLHYGVVALLGLSYASLLLSYSALHG